MSSPLDPSLIKSNEGMSELSSEVIELKQALLHNKWVRPLDDERKWPKAFLKLVHPHEEKQLLGARKRQA